MPKIASSRARIQPNPPQITFLRPGTNPRHPPGPAEPSWRCPAPIPSGNSPIPSQLRDFGEVSPRQGPPGVGRIPPENFHPKELPWKKIGGFGAGPLLPGCFFLLFPVFLLLFPFLFLFLFFCYSRVVFLFFALPFFYFSALTGNQEGSAPFKGLCSPPVPPAWNINSRTRE